MPRAPKICGHPDCLTRGIGTYCPVHTALHQRRANTTGRGYGWNHQQARTTAAATFTPGQPCARCGKPLWTLPAADMGHTDDRTAYRGLEHATCNRRAAAQSKRHHT